MSVRPRRPALAVAVVVIIAGAGVGAACAPTGVGDTNCTALFAYGLHVTVREDAMGSPRICDAIVTASDGDFEETLEPQGPASDCVYVGAGERAGTYRVEAAKDGYATVAEDGVVVAADECHVIGEAVDLVLTPIN